MCPPSETAGPLRMDMSMKRSPKWKLRKVALELGRGGVSIVECIFNRTVKCITDKHQIFKMHRKENSRIILYMRNGRILIQGIYDWLNLNI